MKPLLLTLIVIISQLALGQTEREADQAGNIFEKSPYASPFLDRIARHKGDILTIIVSETSTSSYSANTTLSKTDATSVNNIGIPLLTGLFSSLSTGAKSSNAGTGSTQNVGKLNARMSVMVSKVLPNGNFEVEGVRWIKVNKELQSFKLSGVIRRDDILSDNTILSENIQNAKIEVEGKGGVADRQRRGFLTRLLDWLF